jgi:alpha-tubulin suppressor-like RCC1 family protein
MSLVSVVCCQVEVSASCWSLAQGILNECGLSESGREASIMRRPWPIRSCRSIKKSSGHYIYMSKDMRICGIFRSPQRFPSK